MTKENVKKNVIIMGGGIAGLSACVRLVEQGFNVKILEARNRCGGRIWTEYQSGLPFNRGASWIHGVDDNPIAKLAKKDDAKMVVMDMGKFLYYDRNGFPIANDEVLKFNKKFDLMLLEAKNFSFSEKCDISLSFALATVLKEKKFSSTEEDMLKARLFRFEDYLGATYNHLSGRYWDDEEIWPGETCYLLDGFEPIIEDIKRKCSIQLNSVVNTINIREQGIEIATEDEVFFADHVIVTVPLGVLKKRKITFNPPLPHDKQQAIDRLGMGLLNIASFKFPFSFWPAESHAFRFGQFDHSSISFFFNLHHFNGQPILIGTYGGERGQAIESFSDAELIGKTMENLRKIFGLQIPDPEFCMNTRWMQDPFSYGSYSYFSIGASHQDCESIASSISNRIFFAGEATCSKYPATTHGAYLSGIREADKIISLY